MKFANAAEEEKAKAIAQESKWDTIYMGLAVLAVLALVTGLMVSAILAQRRSVMANMA